MIFESMPINRLEFVQWQRSKFMDIFTTQLTRVSPNRIRPASQKVKNVAKEADTQALEEEHDHLDHHEESTVTHQHAEQQFHQHNSSHDGEEAIENKESAEKDHDTDDEEPHHLDIFV